MAKKASKSPKEGCKCGKECSCGPEMGKCMCDSSCECGCDCGEKM